MESSNPNPPSSANPLPSELKTRAEAILGRATELVRLDEPRSLGFVLDNLRNPAEPSPHPILAVQCGSGLCALVINGADADLVRRTLETNPRLNDTVWAGWRVALVFFVRVSGACPPNTSFKDGLWIRDGLVPLVQLDEPTTSNGFPFNGPDATSVCSLSFADIVWPEAVAETFLLQRVEAVHGPLFRFTPDRVILGDMTAAGYFAGLLKLAYSRNTDTFRLTAAGKTELLPKSKLHGMIAAWLHRQATAAGITCPTESTVPAIIDHLKRLCEVVPLDEAEGLDLFLNERLERRSGASVTTSELLDDYRAFCQAHNAACYAGRKFLGLVTAAIRDRLGVGKNHCVRRPKPVGGVSLRYGFRNLGLKGAIGA